MMNLKFEKIKSYSRYFLIIIISVVFIGFGNQLVFAVEREVNDPKTLSNPLGPGEDMKNPNIVIGKIINSVLGIVGTIALAMFIYGGFRWMTSGGGDGVKAGKETIVWATLGLIVIFMAYAAVKFILGDVLLPTPLVK